MRHAVKNSDIVIRLVCMIMGLVLMALSVFVFTDWAGEARGMLFLLGLSAVLLY